MKTDLDMTLYLVTDSTYHTEETFLQNDRRGMPGWCNTGAAAGEKLRRTGISGESMKVKAITDRYQIPLIIDDRVDVQSPVTPPVSMWVPQIFR